jgi:hypothetical protein
MYLPTKSSGTLSVSVWVLLQHFWGPTQDLKGSVITSLSLVQYPWLARTPSMPCAKGPCWSKGRILSRAKQRSEFWFHKGTWKGSGTNLGALVTRMVGTQLQIQACLRRQKQRLITSQRHLSKALLGGATMSFRFKERGRSIVLCECMKVWVWDLPGYRKADREARWPALRGGQTPASLTAASFPYPLSKWTHGYFTRTGFVWD